MAGGIESNIYTAVRVPGDGEVLASALKGQPGVQQWPGGVDLKAAPIFTAPKDQIVGICEELKKQGVVAETQDFPEGVKPASLVEVWRSTNWGNVESIYWAVDY